MPVTTLYYGNDWETSSKNGTIRTAKILPFVLLFAYIINQILFPKLCWKLRLMCSFMISLFLVSAIGVENSTDLYGSVLYGTLVYFVVYNIVIITLSMAIKIPKLKAFGTVALASGFGALSSYLVYQFGPNFGPPCSN